MVYKVKRIDNPVENWGYYDGFDGPIPDIHYDSPEVISEKWSQYITPGFRINQEHIDNVKQFTTTQVTLPPFGETIWIKGNNLKYLTILDDNETLSCDKIKVDNQVKFEVVDAGNGEIALLGANNMYVSAGNGVNNMLCNAVNIGDTETFKFIQIEDGRIALRSKQGYYVSSEDGQKPVIANRQSIDGWEVFSWGTNFSNGKPKNTTTKIYPNPAKDEVIIMSDQKNYNLKVFNMFSQLVKETNGVEGEMNFSTSDLRPGLYIFFINDEKTDSLVRKIIIH
ncbi:T9SS type A sorting domain-containing protein [Thalassobellus suaedae]|uniref:T9SS type A sorting domain-containing protein n=1 Tax=Thalassobellus suaedae TaxID=3074124 RepID=A0ABY9XTH9_9FLAO|nr:T9SS type A sorting domain-containing protein [Flavobacteriaceae bacterium HL-DH14]